MGRVIIGVDPHKLSATIEVVDEHEQVLCTGRFGTDRDGYRQMLATARRWPQRTWAVEGSQGIGRHLAQRLVADGEAVVDTGAYLERVASRSLPQRVARAVGESPLSERVARAQELAYGPLIEWVRRSPLHTDVLGHSLHPSLTDVTIGCCLSTSLLDLAGGSESRRGATLLATKDR